MFAFVQVAVRRLFRDRTNLFFVVVFPLLLILLLGAAFGGDATQRRIGLVDPAASGAEAALLDEGLAVTVFASSDAARRAVGTSEVVAAVDLTDGADWLVPPGGAGEDLRVRVLDALATGDVDRRAATALASTGVEDAAALVAAVDLPGPRVTTTTLGQVDGPGEFAGLGRFDLGAGQQLLLFVFITSLTGAVAVVQARRWRVLDRVLTGPTSSARLLGGLALGQLAIAGVQALVIVVGTRLLFGVNWGDPLATGLVVVLFAAVATSAGLVLAALVDNEDQVSGLGVPIALALAAFGGSMLPLELFPDALVPVADVTPHAWGNRALAEIVRRDGGVLDVLPELAALGAFALVLGVLAAWLLRRRVAVR